MKKRVIALIIAGSLAVIGVIFLVSHFNRDRYQNPARREWKNNAIREIENYLGNTSALLPTNGEWLSDRMILFEDGSSMLYRQKCHKEDRRIYDIFIGRSSDGDWFYSTYHFCIGASVLRSDEQPSSIDAFATNYFLKEFDGKSDKALLATWPHEAEQEEDGQLLVTRCESDPVQELPDRDSLVGEWVCDRFPDGFTHQASVTATDIVSRLTLMEDGTCTIDRLPVRGPYRFEDIPTDTWRITDGSMTPSGSPSVEIAGNLFQIREAGGGLRLRHTISGKDRYFAEYTKAEEAGAQNP